MMPSLTDKAEFGKIGYKFYYQSKIGLLEFCIQDGALTSLKFADTKTEINEDTALSKEIKTQLGEYFAKKRQKFDIKTKAKGTEFQKKVWKELQKIPYGKTKSYSEIAEKTGHKNSSRAVGNACNKNPILLVIPCHRVLAKNGQLSGFACGVDIKQQLIELER